MKPPASNKNPATLWVISEVYYPEEFSTGYYITSVAEHLADDRPVKVITGQPKHMARGLRAAKHETRNGVEIFRAAGTRLDKNIFFFRLINMATIGISIFFKSLFKFGKRDHVMVVTAPPSLPVTTALAALLKGATFTLLVQDSYPEILVAVGSARPDSLFVRTVHFFNQWVYKHASRIIVMGRDMNELFARKTDGLNIPIVTIPNWADIDSITPTPRAKNRLLKELGLADKFVFLYAGNIGHPTDIETIVDCIQMLLDRPEFHFLFIGAGAKMPWLKSEAEKRRLLNVTLLDYRPRNEQNEFLNACDVGLIALVRGMWGTAMPSRTYNLMAAGKPILALTDEGSELASVIDEENIGWHVDPGDPIALRDAVVEIYEDRSKLDMMGARSRSAATDKYSPAAAHKAYQETLT